MLRSTVILHFDFATRTLSQDTNGDLNKYKLTPEQIVSGMGCPAPSCAIACVLHAACMLTSLMHICTYRPGARCSAYPSTLCLTAAGAASLQVRVWCAAECKHHQLSPCAAVACAAIYLHSTCWPSSDQLNHVSIVKCVPLCCHSCACPALHAHRVASVNNIRCRRRCSMASRHCN